MRIELFGIPRARAGAEVVEVSAADLGGALRALVERCPELSPDVLDGDGRLASGYLVSLDGERFLTDASTPLTDGDTLLLLGAQAGG